MLFQSAAIIALRLFSALVLVVLLALAIALASSYLGGGRATATVLYMFLFASFETVAPLAALLCAVVAALLLARSVRRGSNISAASASASSIRVMKPQC